MTTATEAKNVSTKILNEIKTGKLLKLNKELKEINVLIHKASKQGKFYINYSVKHLTDDEVHTIKDYLEEIMYEVYPITKKRLFKDDVYDSLNINWRYAE